MITKFIVPPSHWKIGLTVSENASQNTKPRCFVEYRSSRVHPSAAAPSARAMRSRRRSFPRVAPVNASVRK